MKPYLYATIICWQFKSTNSSFYTINYTIFYLKKNLKEKTKILKKILRKKQKYCYIL